ncbi:MAG: hypothetical protein GY811_04535 [Myxococcales bacterium]|nr:hypothetical protein [Myxococcales bacterium]
MFLRIFKHVLPRAKAWRITIDKKLRQFFQGLTGTGEDARAHIDGVWLDNFPQTTRALSEWEQQWGLPTTTLTDQERRDRLDGAWKALGGQSPVYLQETLRVAGFDVYVHEWWAMVRVYTAECGEPLAIAGDPSAVCGDLLPWIDPETPVARDPSEFATGEAVGYFANCGGAVMVCGGSAVVCGAANGVTGGLLVNKPDNIGYNIPTDPLEWPYVLYIGGELYGDRANIPLARREEFEALCLKICPAQQWIGLIVEYN